MCFHRGLQEQYIDYCTYCIQLGEKEKANVFPIMATGLIIVTQHLIFVEVLLHWDIMATNTGSGDWIPNRHLQWLTSRTKACTTTNDLPHLHVTAKFTLLTVDPLYHPKSRIHISVYCAQHCVHFCYLLHLSKRRVVNLLWGNYLLYWPVG